MVGTCKLGIALKLNTFFMGYLATVLQHRRYMEVQDGG
jgi:hypothetical protein